MRANLATSSTPGHDFKKTLFALGLYGSEASMRAAQQQAARPADVIDRSPGATLKHTIPSVDIQPMSSQRLWVAEPDIPRIRTFVDEARVATRLGDGADQALVVETADVRSTTLTYLGETLRLTNEPPALLEHLYPTAPGLLISAFWKASAVLPAWRGLPAPIAIGSALVDVALAARLWRQPPDDAQLRETLKIAAANTMFGLTLSATRLCPERTASGDPALAGNSYLLGAALMISSHWSRLSNAQKLVLPSAFVVWLVGGQIRRPVPLLHVLGELLIILTPAVGGWKLTERLDGEAAHVERALQQEFSRACDRAQLAALNDELDEFRRQLAIARDAIAEVAAELDGDTRDKIENECDELENWIASIRSFDAFG